MENTASLEYSFDAFAFCLLWQHSVVQHSGVLEMFASTESLLHSVMRPNCYSHSCTLPGQLFVQQHNKLDQCPDPARETVFSFVSGCWVFFVLVRFRVLGVVFLCLVLVIFKICVSTWAWCRQENKHWDRGQYQQSPWKESLKSIHAKTMLFLCCWFHTSAFLLCIGVCVVTKWVWFDGSSWPDASLSQLLLVHHCLGRHTRASTMHCWGLPHSRYSLDGLALPQNSPWILARPVEDALWGVFHTLISL